MMVPQNILIMLILGSLSFHTGVDVLSVLFDFARLMLQLYKAYTVDEFCRHILPMLVENLAKDHVAEVRLAAVKVVSYTACTAAVLSIL